MMQAEIKRRDARWLIANTVDISFRSIHIMDVRLQPLSHERVEDIYLRVKRNLGQEWIPEIYDCDDFALDFLSLGRRVTRLEYRWPCSPAMGLAAGWGLLGHISSHVLNWFISFGKLYWFEPQTGKHGEATGDEHLQFLFV